MLNFLEKRKKELISGHPVTVAYTLKDGNKHHIPAYWDDEKEQLKFHYISKRDAEAIPKINPEKGAEIIIDEIADNLGYHPHIKFVDSAERGDKMDITEDYPLIHSPRFLLSLAHAADKNCETRVIVGPQAKIPESAWEIVDNSFLKKFEKYLSSLKSAKSASKPT